MGQRANTDAAPVAVPGVFVPTAAPQPQPAAQPAAGHPEPEMPPQQTAANPPAPAPAATQADPPPAESQDPPKPFYVDPDGREFKTQEELNMFLLGKNAGQDAATQQQDQTQAAVAQVDPSKAMADEIAANAELLYNDPETYTRNIMEGATKAANARIDRAENERVWWDTFRQKHPDIAHLSEFIDRSFGAIHSCLPINDPDAAMKMLADDVRHVLQQAQKQNVSGEVMRQSTAPHLAPSGQPPTTSQPSEEVPTFLEQVRNIRGGRGG